MKLIQWKPLDEERTEYEFSMPEATDDLSIYLYEEQDVLIAKLVLSKTVPEELSITVGRDFVVLSGIRQEEKEISDRDYYSKEIRRNFFLRTLELPRPVDAGRISAEYKDGLLSVVMPLSVGMTTLAYPSL